MTDAIDSRAAIIDAALYCLETGQEPAEVLANAMLDAVDLERAEGGFRISMPVEQARKLYREMAVSKDVRPPTAMYDLWEDLDRRLEEH